jgi:hypothetical protein
MAVSAIGRATAMITRTGKAGYCFRLRDSVRVPDGNERSGGLAVSEQISQQSIEIPDADAAEQAREVPEEDNEELSAVPLEVDEADAAEQIRDAGYDDEDYR